MGQKLDIIVLSGVSKGDVFHLDLDPSAPISLGRDPECSLVLQDPTVSRKHLEIFLKSDGIYMADQGSSHGTVLMGFKLSPGEAGSRKLSDEDEFKIGDAIFRVSFDEDAFATPVEDVESSGNGQPRKRPQANKGILANKKLLGLAAIAVLALLLLLIPEEKKPALPPQLSRVPMNLPQERVIGYWPSGGKEKGSSDSRHADKAQFLLPGADLVVEYDYRSATPLQVSIDQLAVETLPASPDHWQTRQILVRDLLLGQERRLIFDNPDWPPKGNPENRPAKPKKFWAVRDMRATPLPRDLDSSFEKALNSAIAVSSRLQSSTDAHYMLLRGLQKTVVEALGELSIDAMGIGLNLESKSPEGPEVLQLLESIKSERAAGSIDADRHLEAMVDLIARVDAELWRRSNARFAKARYSATVKDWIVAFDTLEGVKSMFPDEADFRWVLANRMLNDKKIVPKKVAQSPAKYRRRRYKDK